MWQKKCLKPIIINPVGTTSSTIIYTITCRILRYLISYFRHSRAGGNLVRPSRAASIFALRTAVLLDSRLRENDVTNILSLIFNSDSN